MKQVFLVRHGQTAGNQARLLRGAASQSDPLNEVGQEQARRCAQALAARQLTRPKVYASTFLRAQQTAQAIAEALNTDVTVLEGIHEMDIGSWEGQPVTRLHDVHELIDPSGGFAFPEGEHIRDLVQRCRTTFDGLPDCGETAIVVSHGLALQALLNDLMGTDFAQCWQEQRYGHRNTAISELKWDGERWHAVDIGNSKHLED